MVEIGEKWWKLHEVRAPFGAHFDYFLSKKSSFYLEKQKSPSGAARRASTQSPDELIKEVLQRIFLRLWRRSGFISPRAQNCP